MTRLGRLLRRMGAALLLLAPFTASARAQGNCNVNNQAACEVGGTASFALTITIVSAVSIAIPSGSVALTAADFTSGFGAPIAVPVTVRANQSWSVSLSASSALWTGSPLTARQDKPAADLQWALAPGGPFTDLGLTPQTISTGPGTSGTVVGLQLRPRYGWTLDVPGSYSLPLQLTITAP
jgi:hypothetical protein